MVTIFCLDCEHEIDLEGRLGVSRRVICPNCKEKFEIITLEPLRIDWVYEGPTTNTYLFDEPQEEKKH